MAQSRLVTLIEILSPANKVSLGSVRVSRATHRVVQTRTHLLEIDLLRGGTRIELLAQPPAAPYYVYLSRTERRPYTQIWPIALHHRLPVMPVPLLQPDPDVVLDLQAAVNACFALVGYERLQEYNSPPPRAVERRGRCLGGGTAANSWIALTSEVLRHAPTMLLP